MVSDRLNFKKMILRVIRGRRLYPIILMCGLILAFLAVLQWGFVSISSADLYAPTILSAKVVTPPMNPIPSTGDLWMNTWADDDNIYTGWGDGEGPGDVKPGTDCGVGVFKGPVPYFLIEQNPSDYVRSRFVPDGRTGRDDKPSSLLFFNGRLYFAGHTPLGDPKYGYIAYSDDYGRTWVEVPDSPWTRTKKSVFRCLFFINMGKNYELNKDGYVYALGIGKEWDWFPPMVYLVRVPMNSILDYNSYRYYAGMNGGAPVWSMDESDALPLKGLEAHQMGSAMYHEGIERYLFLAIDGLFEAPYPWGPWVKVSALLNSGDDPEWKGGYMPGIIAKGAGADFFYFTLAGQSNIIRYNLYIGKISFQLNSEIEVQASASPTIGRAPLSVQFRGSGVAPGATITSYRWYFGDGAISTEQNPSHVYTSPTYGKYRAMLTVTDNQGRRGFDIVEITVPFCELSLRNPEDPDSCKAGLHVKYYDLPPEGGENVPDFSTMTEYKTDIVSQINFLSLGIPRNGGVEFATSGRRDNVAALFTGYLEVPTDGVYTFYLLSDDASELYIGDERIIDNNGEHKMQMRERAGQIGLKAGKHALRVGYTEINLLNGLRLYWEGPGFSRELVPASVLCHEISKKGKSRR
ncbi:MAG: PA14 domain-containing protein [Candidatus Aminicenantia bacterium]